LPLFIGTVVVADEGLVTVSPDHPAKPCVASGVAVTVGVEFEKRPVVPPLAVPPAPASTVKE
jgi:hypothetical protein